MRREVIERHEKPTGPIMVVEIVQHDLDNGQTIYSVHKMLNDKFERLYGNIQTIAEAKELAKEWMK